MTHFLFPIPQARKPVSGTRPTYLSGRPAVHGFTLIEALVSLAVLSVGLIPAFAQVTISFQVARSIRHNLSASMLAQEGIELVRGIRDDNWFAGVSFDGGLDTCTAGCRIHYPEAFILPLADNAPLLIDTQGRYQYMSGTETAYARRITIIQMDATHLKIESEVTWNDRGELRAVLVEDHLFDWLNP
jgi:prepilin-type N-terminal cleavage/methylation domain-containing protein